MEPIFLFVPGGGGAGHRRLPDPGAGGPGPGGPPRGEAGGLPQPHLRRRWSATRRGSAPRPTPRGSRCWWTRPTGPTSASTLPSPQRHGPGGRTWRWPASTRPLPSLTQTAVLHASGRLVPPAPGGPADGDLPVQLPSYLLMASMDGCLGLLEDQGRPSSPPGSAGWRTLTGRSRTCGTSAARATGKRRADPPRRLCLGPRQDPHLHPGQPLTGVELKDRLRADYRIGGGDGPDHYVVAMTGLGNDDTMPTCLPVPCWPWTGQCGPLPGGRPPPVQRHTLPPRRCSVEEAAMAQGGLSFLYDAMGKVSGEYLWAYPRHPSGDPGEEITVDLVETVEQLYQAGVRLIGTRGKAPHHHLRPGGTRTDEGTAVSGAEPYPAGHRRERLAGGRGATWPASGCRPHDREARPPAAGRVPVAAGRRGGHRPGLGGLRDPCPGWGGCGRCCPWWCSRWRTPPSSSWPGRRPAASAGTPRTGGPCTRPSPCAPGSPWRGVTAAAPLAGEGRLDPPQTGWPWCGPAWGAALLVGGVLYFCGALERKATGEMMGTLQVGGALTGLGAQRP